MQLAPDPADLAERLAEVDLGVPGRMRQRDEDLLGPALLLPNVVGDDGDAAGEAVLVAQPLEDPLRGVPLLLRRARSASRIWSMIGRNGSSFGRAGSFDRRYPGGTECFRIFATVLRSIPNNRAAARSLNPSTWHARRTRA